MATVLEPLEGKRYESMEKIAFSCARDEGFLSKLMKTGRGQVILTGMESHVCVYQTALDLVNAGYEAFVPEDAVSSRHLSDHPGRDRGHAGRRGQGGSHGDRGLPALEDGGNAGVQEDFLPAAMKAPARGIALAFLTVLLALACPAGASRQVVALFPPEVEPAAEDNVLLPAVPILEKAMKEQLEDRFEVRTVGFPARGETSRERNRAKARTIGASYTITGTVSRIGKGVTMDVTLAPIEESGKGRTVVVSGTLDDVDPPRPGMPSRSAGWGSTRRGR